MNQQPAENPDDQIWINLLCPAQDYRGRCTQASCGLAPKACCSLNGKPWAAYCVIPNSHPVTQFRLEMLAADPRRRGEPLS